MASAWGDDIDEELKQNKRIKVGFLFNYMQMGNIIKQLDEETREWDSEYPKSELLKIWGSAMFIIFVLALFSYKILIAATGLFFFFYGHILIQVFKAWRRFEYSGWKYWLMTLMTLVVIFIAAYFLRGLIFGA